MTPALRLFVLWIAIPTAAALEDTSMITQVKTEKETAQQEEVPTETAVTRAPDVNDAIVTSAVITNQIQTLCRLEYGDTVCKKEGLLR